VQAKNFDLINQKVSVKTWVLKIQIMVNQLITIFEAANLTNKSVQTIRRLIKTGKVKFKRKRTAQGFNYMVDKASLLQCFGMINQQAPVEEPTVPESTPVNKPLDYPETPTTQAPQNSGPEIYILESTESEAVSLTEIETEPTPMPEPKPQEQPSSSTTQQDVAYTVIIDKLLDQHRADKDKLYQLVELFQKRVIDLEEQVKLLQAPKKKWWQVWK